jgi:hypothetical protein
MTQRLADKLSSGRKEGTTWTHQEPALGRHHPHDAQRVLPNFFYVPRRMNQCTTKIAHTFESKLAGD